MSSNGLSVAVVGATGAVGREILDILAERQFPAAAVKALASARSAGEELEFADDTLIVEELTPESFKGVNIALFSAGGEVSKQFAPHAVESAAVVIDNSSAFRMEPEIPLTVPEVNAEELRVFLRSLSNTQGAIIANPNCSTIQLAVVLKPIADKAGLQRVVVSTYQSVSGAGQKGLEELWEQTVALLNQTEPTINKFPHQIAFNCLPHIDSFLDNGYTKEEMKVIYESRKILGLPELKITCTAVRVPVFACHAESVNIQTERPLSAIEARELLHSSPGIIVADNPTEQQYPLGINVVGTDATFVGRIREDHSVENGLNLWVVADNIRKGAALNAVQIAEVVFQERFAG